MSSDDIVKVLSASLGQDKARAVVNAALAKLGLTTSFDLSHENTRQVLEEVGREGGLVAAAAKIAGLRLDALPR